MNVHTGALARIGAAIEIGRSRNAKYTHHQLDPTMTALSQMRAYAFPPQTAVYAGMIVGEHNRENDLEVNVCRAKKMTNVRSACNDKNIEIAPPRQFSLEAALEYIEDDELLEVTPQNLRMRKRILNSAIRKRNERRGIEEE